jgi:predicted hotdog family 3-hydroxylacyl-ACP dehydratase
MISESNCSFPIDASQFLPHKPPMLMVEQIISVNDQEKSSVIETTVRPDSLFLSEENTLYGEALIEIMAQAAAAQHGYNLAKENKHEEKGFIVGIRKFEITGEASVNDKLSVSVKLGPEIESLSVVYGTVTCRSNQIASIELTVWHG